MGQAVVAKTWKQCERTVAVCHSALRATQSNVGISARADNWDRDARDASHKVGMVAGW